MVMVEGRDTTRVEVEVSLVPTETWRVPLSHWVVVQVAAAGRREEERRKKKKKKEEEEERRRKKKEERRKKKEERRKKKEEKKKKKKKECRLVVCGYRRGDGNFPHSIPLSAY